MHIISYLALALVITLWTVAQVSLKYTFHVSSQMKMVISIQNLIASQYFWIWFISSTVATILWLYILRTIPLNQAYPALGLTYALVPLTSHSFMKEKVVFTQWLGIVIIVTGIVLVVQK